MMLEDIRARIGDAPIALGMILGSGLGQMAEIGRASCRERV